MNDPCLLNIIILVFLMLILSFHVSQYCSSFVMHFCNDIGHVDIIIRSSAYIKHESSVFPTYIGLLPSNLNISGKSFKNRLKSVELSVSPCLTPLLLGKVSLSLSFTIILLVVVVYIDLIILRNFP